MTTDEAIKWAGGLRQLAAKLEIWPHTIYSWGQHPPMTRQYQLEVISGGELKAWRRPEDQANG